MRPLRAIGASALVLFALAAGSATAKPQAAIVDPQVQQEAASVSATTPIPVIVYGKKLGTGPAALTVTQPLGDNALAGTVAAGDLGALAASKGVVYIGPDNPVVPTGDGNGKAKAIGSASVTGSRSVLPLVDGAPTAWARGYTGAHVGIAVVDSGVSSDNDFGRRLVTVTGVGGRTDTFGHGTFVADVAAGASKDGEFAGIAPGATLVGVNVNNPAGVRTSDVLAGLLWVLQNRAQYNIRVVNLSLAETTPRSYLADALDSTVEQLWQSGVVVVVSAGNLGPGSAAFAPANDPFAISVGATDTQGTLDPGDDAVAPWSTSGTTPDGFAKPELVAPGRRVIGLLPWTSTLGRLAPDDNWVVKEKYAMISGTSFSAPQVAGAAAVLLQEHPDWTPDQVKWVLQSTARPVAGSAAGSLDLAAATAYSGAPPAANQGIPDATFGLSAWVDSLAGSNGNGSNGNRGNGNGWNGNGWNSNGWNSNGWNDLGWK